MDILLVEDKLHNGQAKGSQHGQSSNYKKDPFSN